MAVGRLIRRVTSLKSRPGYLKGEAGFVSDLQRVLRDKAVFELLQSTELGN